MTVARLPPSVHARLSVSCVRPFCGHRRTLWGLLDMAPSSRCPSPVGPSSQPAQRFRAWDGHVQPEMGEPT